MDFDIAKMLLRSGNAVAYNIPCFSRVL